MYVNVSYKGTVQSYTVSRAMLVQNMKEEISRKQNLHQFKLMLGQTELLDQSPVIKYLFTTFALCYDDKTAAVEINDMNLGVAVVNPEVQKVITEKATPEMTVVELKERLSRELSSTQGKLTLKMDGKEVPDGDLLKTHLEVKTLTVNMQDMQVTIQYEGRQYSITTKSDVTIIEFKRLCSETMGIPVNTNLCKVSNGGKLKYLDYIHDPKWVRWKMDFYSDEAAPWIEEMRTMKSTANNRTLGYHGITQESALEIIYYVAAPTGL